MIQYMEFTSEGNRELNEDRYGVALSGNSHCFVVADGLGGHGNGEIAAQAAVDAVCMTFVDEGFTECFFDHAFSAAQEAILQQQEEMQAPSRMKTTLVILVIHDGKAMWAHVGDSRLYCFKHGKLKNRTIDHSVPQMLALSGEIKEKDIRHHPDRNRLMRVMGIRGEQPRFEVSAPVKMAGEYAFLLCTDGFWELIEETEMERTLKSSSAPESWVNTMSDIVRTNGEGSEMDNFTAIAINVREKGLFGKWL